MPAPQVGVRELQAPPAPAPAGQPPAVPTAAPPRTAPPVRDADRHLDELRLKCFLRESAPAKALAAWLGPTFSIKGGHVRRRVADLLSQDIARIDEALSRQVNAILHHPAFQKLEASWRGLRHLIDQVPADVPGIKIRVLNVSWKELVKDLVVKSIEFDQSQLFKKVYEEQFGIAGGEPFGMLVGDYDVYLRPGPDHPTDDLEALRKITEVAAAAFAPFVAAAHPSLLELPSFGGLDRLLDLGRTFDQVEFVKWRSLRQAEDSRFVGLTLPRVLMRVPYTDHSGRVDGFRFHEDVEPLDRSGYLWGNAAYAFAGVVVRAFATSGWVAGIRGVRRGEESGGLVSGLPVHSFGTDRHGLVPKTSTEVAITDMQDKELADHGFIPLCACPDTEYSAFYGSQSLQKPKVYDELAATVNARLSASLQYMLCVSRFAHYVKVIARNKVGSTQGALELEDFLGKWLRNYCNASDSATPDVKARYPLREARVQIREVPGKPGSYNCEIHLRPHFQLDQMVSTVRLRTNVSSGQRN
jgi:type VI secretion system ImpC/EvpB family protein